MSIIDFIRTLRSDYRVATVFPSTIFAAKTIAREMPAFAKVVIEYGPGDGAVTRELLKALPVDGRLIAIESNADFTKELQKIADPRLDIITGDVADISKSLNRFGEIDMIVSGIPFSFFNEKVREEIVANSCGVLRDGGKILLYQHSLLMLHHLKRYCRKNTRWFIELRNVWPYFIMIGEK